MKLIKAKNQTEIFTVVYIRKDVFINEQNVDVNEELDGRDILADHFLVKDNNKYVATARVYYENDTAIIGRVAVLKSYRNSGYAKFMLKNIISILKENKNLKTVHLGAQVQAQGFYEKLNFKVSGDLYLDANIEHYPMELKL